MATASTIQVKNKTVKISAKEYGGLHNRWKLNIVGDDCYLTWQFYMKTIHPRDFGLNAGRSWGASKSVKVVDLLNVLEGRRGNALDLRKTLLNIYEAE